jgi:hypothetical protein
MPAIVYSMARQLRRRTSEPMERDDPQSRFSDQVSCRALMTLKTTAARSLLQQANNRGGQGSNS